MERADRPLGPLEEVVRREAAAFRMLRLNIRASVVAKATGLTPKTVQRFAREIDPGLIRKGWDPGYTRLLDTLLGVAHGALVISVYNAVASRHSPSVALWADRFVEILSLMDRLGVTYFSSSELYAIVDGYRRSALETVVCSLCDISYPHPDQSHLSGACPFCSKGHQVPALMDLLGLVKAVDNDEV
jgi:hypothetical protein